MGMYTVEGTIATWLIPSGAYIEAGEPVLEIETEKSTLEVVAPTSGFLHHVARPGSQIQVESLVGYILAAGETAPGEISETAIEQSQQPIGQQPTETLARGEVIASPIAKRLAAAGGLDISTCTGTGPGGRIVEADVRKALARLGKTGIDIELNSIG